MDWCLVFVFVCVGRSKLVFGMTLFMAVGHGVAWHPWAFLYGISVDASVGEMSTCLPACLPACLAVCLSACLCT